MKKKSVNYILTNDQLGVILEQLRTDLNAPKQPPSNQQLTLNQVFSKKPPLGWEQYEQTHKLYNEPSASPTSYQKGKVTGRILPPQTNAYFYNGQTGSWESKGLNNVNLWRDVPAGVHPSEYQKYLKFEEDRKINPYHVTGIESTSVVSGGISNKKNPYLNSFAPLGITQQDKQNREQEIKNTESYYQETSFKDKSDTPYEMTKQQRDKRAELLYKIQNEEIKKINDKYNIFAQKIANEDDPVKNFLDILSFALYVIPYTAPFAPYISGGFKLYSAWKKFEKGDHRGAAVEVLFSLLVGSSVERALKNASVLNGLTSWARTGQLKLPPIEKNEITNLFKILGEESKQYVKYTFINANKNPLIIPAMNAIRKKISDYEKEFGAYQFTKYVLSKGD